MTVQFSCWWSLVPGNWGAQMMSNLHYKWWPPSPSSSEDCHHVLPSACGTWWNVAPGPSSAVLRSPVRYTPMPLQLSLGFFLRSWGWATPRLAGLWGAAQQSLKKKKGELWSWHISMLLIKRVTNMQTKTRNNDKQVSLPLLSNIGGSHKRNV